MMLDLSTHTPMTLHADDLPTTLTFDRDVKLPTIEGTCRYAVDVDASYGRGIALSDVYTDADLKLSLAFHDFTFSGRVDGPRPPQPIVEIGTGGSLPSHCLLQSVGTPYAANLALSGTDRFMKGYLEVKDGNGGEGDISFTFGVDYYVSASVTVTPGEAFVEDPTGVYHANRIAIEHTPYFGNMCYLHGLYFDGGSMEFTAGFLAQADEPEAGVIVAELPLMFGVVEYRALLSYWTHLPLPSESPIEVLDLRIPYLRLEGLERPVVTATCAPQSIDVGETTDLEIGLLNQSNEVTLEHAVAHVGNLGSWLYAPESTVDLLAGPDGASTPLSPGGQRSATLPLVGAQASGLEIRPQVTLDWRYGEPVPSDAFLPDVVAGSDNGVVVQHPGSGLLAGTVAAPDPISLGDVVVAACDTRDLDEDAAFSFANLVPGEYTLRTTHPECFPHETTVEVQADETSFVDVELIPIGIVGNRRTKEAHKPDCGWVRRMRAENRELFASWRKAKARGYDRCAYCMPQ